jgi:hypothetical protein
MLVNGLQIPGRLLALIDAGLWPLTADEAMKQNLRSLVSEERIHLFAPEESKLYLYPPPFCTIAKGANRAEGDFWSKFGAIEEIVPEAAIEIADFGIGADSPILLDYRASSVCPSVIRLCWLGEWGVINNHWVSCAPSFDSFADMLALEV